MSLAHGIAHVRGATAIGRFAARSSALVSAAAPLVRIPGNTTRGATRVMATGSSASLTYGKPIVMPARQQHSATVIMLHGLGDTGDGWADIGPMFAADLPQVKFVFPTAPRRPITLNMGMNMTGWYDIASLDGINQQEDEEGLTESKRYVEELIQKETEAGIPSDRVVVAGFSQGGAVALMMLRSKKKLAAVVGLSTYLPLRSATTVISEANLQTPVLMCHGDADTVVAYRYGQQSAASLKSFGSNVEFKTYPRMPHSACPEELKEVAEFMKRHLPPL